MENNLSANASLEEPSSPDEPAPSMSSFESPEEHASLPREPVPTNQFETPEVPADPQDLQDAQEPGQTNALKAILNFFITIVLNIASWCLGILKKEIIQTVRTMSTVPNTPTVPRIRLF